MGHRHQDIQISTDPAHIIKKIPARTMLMLHARRFAIGALLLHGSRAMKKPVNDIDLGKCSQCQDEEAFFSNKPHDKSLTTLTLSKEDLLENSEELELLYEVLVEGRVTTGFGRPKKSSFTSYQPHSYRPFGTSSASCYQSVQCWKTIKASEYLREKAGIKPSDPFRIAMMQVPAGTSYSEWDTSESSFGPKYKEWLTALYKGKRKAKRDALKEIRLSIQIPVCRSYPRCENTALPSLSLKD